MNVFVVIFEMNGSKYKSSYVCDSKESVNNKIKSIIINRIQLLRTSIYKTQVDTILELLYRDDVPKALVKFRELHAGDIAVDYVPILTKETSKEESERMISEYIIRNIIE